MISTKTDKSAIDLAGVEAGAKILVALAGGSPATRAQIPAGDQTRRSMVCATNRDIENLVIIRNSLLKQGTL
jgi:hypothetical protein